MADKSIFDLTLQSTFGVNDRLVIGNYANNDAEAILGQTLISLLTTALDGHGGIQSIAKTSSTGTNPVVDTYTITYADASTSTFTITNGLKGDTGAQTYVYLRWAHECTGTPPVPASWASTTSDPDDWIGIGTGTSSSPPTNVNSYKWYQYKGDKGDTGTAATITTQTVSYQASASGIVVPSGTWSSTVPTVSQGSYLWTRTELTFNDGTTVTSYSVGRMGIDGSGAVSTVNNVSVDVGTTNITLTGGDIPIDSTPSANVAVVTDANGKFAPASVSATELNMLSGANSNIQTQINSNKTESAIFGAGRISAFSGTNLVVFGDSWTEDGITNSVNAYWPKRVASAFGMTLYNFAVAGAGWGRSTSLIATQITTAESNMTAEQKAKTTCVVAIAGINDILNSVSAADVEAGFVNFNTEIARIFPNAQQIIVPFNWGFGGLTSSINIFIETELHKFYGYLTKPAIILPDARYWLLGVKSNYQNANHPSTTGYDRIAGRIMNAMLGNPASYSSIGQEITLLHGNDKYCWYTFENGMIHFYVKFTTPEALTDYTAQFATLPPICIPEQDIQFPIICMGNRSLGGTGRFRNEYGDFYVTNLSSAGSNSQMIGTVSYRACCNATWSA